MIRIRYGRTYNMGNFQSERIEVEHDFPDDTPLQEATEKEILEVEKIHEHSVAYLQRKHAQNLKP